MNRTPIDQFVVDKVKEMRISNNYSQIDLAVLLEVSNGFIGKIESNKFTTKYNLSHINKLAKVFNCSPKDFLPDSFIE